MQTESSYRGAAFLYLEKLIKVEEDDRYLISWGLFSFLDQKHKSVMFKENKAGIGKEFGKKMPVPKLTVFGKL